MKNSNVLQQPSPLANGSYSSPGSVGLQKGNVKGKVAGRPDSRDVVFSPAAGQGGPPPQMSLHMQNSPVGTALPGAVRMEVPSSSSALGNCSIWSNYLYSLILVIEY